MAAASPDLGTGPTNQQGPSPQTGSTTPTGQVIGPLPASTMPGQLAQSIPTMANFQFLLGALNQLQNEINNLTPGGAVSLTALPPLAATPPTITNTGSFSHLTSGVVAGTYGDATHVAQVTVDQFGHVDKLLNVPVTGGGGAVSLTAVFPIVATPPTITGTGAFSHGASGVTPTTYGDSTHYPIFTVEADGHITSASQQTFPPGSTLQSQAFTGAGTYTFNVPAGVSGVWLKMVGAGGAGGGIGSGNAAGGGGGAGELCENLTWPVTAAGTATVIIGAGGVGAAGVVGPTGGDTSFNNGTLTAKVKGGLGGTGVNGTLGGTGGGPLGAVDSNTTGAGYGLPESPSHFGGSSGGQGGSPGTGSSGGLGPGFPVGAVGGAPSGGHGGGGGGAATEWGLGGVGGAGAANGTNATSTNYGTGGGGAGAGTNTVGGNGADGYCLVSWVS